MEEENADHIIVKDAAHSKSFVYRDIMTSIYPFSIYDSVISNFSCLTLHDGIKKLRGLNLHMEPDEFQVALKWWIGLDNSHSYVALTALTTSWILLGIMP